MKETKKERKEMKKIFENAGERQCIVDWKF